MISIKKGSLQFGKGTTFQEPFASYLEMHPNSTIICNNTFIIRPGTHVILASNARLNLGSGFINRFCRIRCFKGITIGNNVRISENVTMWDSDAHELIDKKYSNSKEIVIQDNVWIGTNTTILKGVTIGNGSIVAAGSVVNKSIPPKCLVGGVPAKILRRDVEWK
ncbi:acyltransferase [Jiulongibacter sp. NS-SX5]|uniref:acyltransferase n=1 Tax=Jiulongibacter sp. NS-SX5 TaxID=3463854 RepID=UPI004058E05C